MNDWGMSIVCLGPTISKHQHRACSGNSKHQHRLSMQRHAVEAALASSSITVLHTWYLSGNAREKSAKCFPNPASKLHNRCMFFLIMDGHDADSNIQQLALQNTNRAAVWSGMY